MKRCRYCGDTPVFARFARGILHMGCAKLDENNGHENWVQEKIATKEINGEIVNDEQATIQILVKLWNKGN
jgi:hypothetical protein